MFLLFINLRFFLERSISLNECIPIFPLLFFKKFYLLGINTSVAPELNIDFDASTRPFQLREKGNLLLTEKKSSRMRDTFLSPAIMSYIVIS